MKNCRLCRSELENGNLLPPDGVDFKKFMDEIEFEIVSEALRRARGNQAKAGRLLNLPAHAFRYLVEKHRLDPLAISKAPGKERFDD